MKGIIVKQELEINVEEFLEKAMVLYSYDMFALLISGAVMKSDDPAKLSEIIEKRLRSMWG